MLCAHIFLFDSQSFQPVLALKLISWPIVDIKTDSASGTDDNNRPEVKELLKGAINKEYDCVIMKGISRIYRKTSKGLEIQVPYTISIFSCMRIKVFLYSNNPDTMPI